MSFKKTTFSFLLTLLILSFMALNSCESKTTVRYADHLDCLGEKDIAMLNEGCELFEKKIIERYEEDDIGKAYRYYIEDFADNKIKRDFLFDSESKAFLKKLKNSKTFDKIWCRESAIPKEIEPDIELYYEDYMVQSKDRYCLNPDGEYINCLIDKSDEVSMVPYLKSLRYAQRMSSSLKARALARYQRSIDFYDDLTRLTVAIQFYHEENVIHIK